jgi:thioredoxin-like negative regulator of GroEL
MLPEATDRNFDRLVETATVPVLVEFWQPGCGHCRALMREMEVLQRELEGKIMIVAMNVQENFQIPAELEISSLPVLALYENGVFQRFIGGMGKKDAVKSQLYLS